MNMSARAAFEPGMLSADLLQFQAWLSTYVVVMTSVLAICRIAKLGRPSQRSLEPAA